MSDFDTGLAVPSIAHAARTHRRLLLKAGLFGAASLAVGLRAPAVRGQAKRFAGVVIQGAAFQHAFHTALKTWLPEFEEQTGLKVVFDLQSYPIYYQRADLELSTRGSAYDFCNIGNPYAGRWISAGWMTPLADFTDNAELTPPDWGSDDFPAATSAILSDTAGQTFGYPWVAGAILLGVSRIDILEKAKLPIPSTCDELLETCLRTHQPGVAAAFVNDALHHWEWPPYLMAEGGRVLRNPPADVLPMLDTPIAAKAAQTYADLLSKCSPPGGISFTDDQALRQQYAGRANMRTCSLDWLVPVAKSPDSKVKDTVRFAPMPGGPGGSFPAVNANGFGIPAGARNKEAAWMFIQWATSKAVFRRQALEKSQVGVPRTSVLQSPEYREAMTINGQDVGKLYLDTISAEAPKTYMKYRQTPIFPQVGEKINKAIEQIASGQMDAKTAMSLAQAAAVEDIKKAGVKL